MKALPARRDAPTLLHVSDYRFGRRHHPATWRHIVGLAPHFRSIVLSGGDGGYFPEGHCDDDRIAAEAGIHVHPLHQPMSALREPAVVASVVTALTQSHGPIDAIIGHLKCGAHAVHLERRLRAPILAMFHGDDANFQITGEIYGPDYRWLRAAPASRFLAVSQNLADRLLAFGMPPERTFVHHLGLELESFKPPERREAARSPRIVMVGSFRRQKGHAMAIRGFAEFFRDCPGASLHFIGQGHRPEHSRLRDELFAFAHRMGLARAVHFHGAVPVDVLPRYLADADIGLQSSVFIPDDRHVEGIPNAILEEMAMGLPVVATRHGGIPEAVLHERTGLLVEEHDIAGLANALARLAADPALRDRLGRAGREHVEAEFCIERQCAGLADHVRRMIADYAAIGAHAREAASLA
jgi:glycosyltransferase involved in cell wall biosynthesis